MGRIIQFDCDDRREFRVAKNEVEMFRADAVEMLAPSSSPLRYINQIGKPDLREHRVARNDSAQDLVKRTFSSGKEILLLRVRQIKMDSVEPPGIFHV